MSLRGAKRRGNLNSIYNNSYVSHSIRAPLECHHTILDCRAALAMTSLKNIAWQATPNMMASRQSDTPDGKIYDLINPISLMRK